MYKIYIEMLHMDLPPLFKPSATRRQIGTIGILELLISHAHLSAAFCFWKIHGTNTKRARRKPRLIARRLVACEVCSPTGILDTQAAIPDGITSL